MSVQQRDRICVARDEKRRETRVGETRRTGFVNASITCAFRIGHRLREALDQNRAGATVAPPSGDRSRCIGSRSAAQRVSRCVPRNGIDGHERNRNFEFFARACANERACTRCDLRADALVPHRVISTTFSQAPRVDALSGLPILLITVL